jgi:peptidoglycan/LPS O-acetylase OafA/YrhL
MKLLHTIKAPEMMPGFIKKVQCGQRSFASDNGAMPELSAPGQHQRIAVLDGLRGFAIAAVMIHHFSPYANPPSKDSRIGVLLFFLAASGWCGVDLFFVLSGFLITGILLDQKPLPHFFRNFYARRTLRIFPLYYGVLFAVFILGPLIWPAAFHAPEMMAMRHRQGWLWIYGTNVDMTIHNDYRIYVGQWLFLAGFWSLAVEEHFYLVWPAIVRFCNDRALLAVCGVCVLLSLVTRLVFFRLQNDWGVYTFTLSRIDELAIGGSLSVLIRHRSSLLNFLSRWAWLIATLCFVGWIANTWKDALRLHWFAVSAGYLLVGISFGALLLHCVTTGPESIARRIFELRGLRILGKYSYGLYIYHILLMPMYEHWFGQRRWEDILERRLHLTVGSYFLSVIAYMIAASAVSFIVAWVSWQVMEKQFLRMKRFFDPSTPVPTPAA